MRILDLARDGPTGMGELARTVASDPELSSRLLLVANAPLAGVTRATASVAEAVERIGVTAVTAIAVVLSLAAQYRRGVCTALDFEEFWPKSVARAVTARHVAHRIGGFASADAFAIGLISRIGQLALATVYPEAYAMAINRSLGCALPLAEVEQEVFQTDHLVLGGAMLEEWRFHPVFLHAVLRQDTAPAGKPESDTECDTLAGILRLGDRASDLLVYHRVVRDSLTSVMLEASRLGLGPEVFPEVFDCLRDEWTALAPVLAVTTHRVPAFGELYSMAL